MAQSTLRRIRARTLERSRAAKDEETAALIGLVGCGCYIVALVAYVVVSAFSFQYCLWSIVGKDIPWYADAVAGFFLGWATLWVAVACWIARLCGVPVPFVGAA